MSHQPLAPRGGNDLIFTPPHLAAHILSHFLPHGRILEPCRGNGSFSNLIPGCDWFEITEGRDFMDANGHWDWIVTNPPWSKFREFLNHSMRCADNVVFLSLINAFFMRARMRDMRFAGFGIVEILELPQPTKPWPQTGFCLGATHIKRGYSGPTRITCLPAEVV